MKKVLANTSDKYDSYAALENGANSKSLLSDINIF
jgi:hypothetical protein